MPKFMKSLAIDLIDSGITTYTLGLFGLQTPHVKTKRQQNTRYAPVMGLFGSAVELIVKACLVQGKGLGAMFEKGNVNSKTYKYGSVCIDELKQEIKKDSPEFDFIWESSIDHSEQKERIIYFLNKFKLLQTLRADGLHAGKGCSRDIAVATANDIYSFFETLAKGKRIKAYIKGIPVPESTIRDREAIIEDLARRVRSSSVLDHKINLLRGMYLVLPYVPDLQPEWIERFDSISIVPPTIDDVKYLLNTLEDAHNIYLLKTRGGKEGLPVKVEPNNTNALPIDIQNIKRTLNSIPAQFNNDVLTANTRFDQGRLDLPIDDFLIDLYALGLQKSNVLQVGQKLTAQQAWPFIVSAYSTQGTPRPCWQFVSNCDEIPRLETYIQKSAEFGNGYYKRRVENLLKCIHVYSEGTIAHFQEEKHKDNIFCEAERFAQSSKEEDNRSHISALLIKKYTPSATTQSLLLEYQSRRISAGDVIEKVLLSSGLQSEDRMIINALIKKCNTGNDRNGLVAILRSDNVKQYHSLARKQMFFVDLCESGVFIEKEL